MAISNTPIASSQLLSGGLTRVAFATSPKLSSYLLFFGLGDFERISRKVDGVDIGVIVKRGDTDKAQFALDAASDILPYYEDYFGMKYPLPKLDLIAGPGSSQFFGAMENWGAIFYFESDLEIDPKLSTESDRRGVYVTVAHEMAHRWFGDLVTMDWWDDLWLNEGFASWMEVQATDHFHPEWKLWLDAQGAKESAMRLDARAGTHSIIQPIRDVLQANEAFDTITYSKGMAVIRMLETYTGEDAFRAGVRNYIKAHAYGNTITDDLWRELDKTSPRPVTMTAHDLTLRPGVPLIRVTRTDGGVTLSQERFAMDDASKVPLTWHVPVLEQALGGGPIWRGVVARGATTSIAGDTASGFIVNEGQTSYFRTLYDPSLVAILATHFHALSAEDQLGLLNDSRMLGYTGYEPLADFLTLAHQADPTLDPQVQDTLVGRLQGIDTLYDGMPSQAAFRAFGRRLLAPLFAKIGWDAKPGESQNVALLRATLLAALSQFEDEAVIAEARAHFAAYLRDSSKIAPDTRRSVLSIVTHHADATTWDRIHALAKGAKSTLAKEELYGLLGAALDRALARKALDLALTDEAVVTTRPEIIRNVSNKYPELAFDFVAAHLDAVNSWLETDSRNQFPLDLAANAHDVAMIAKLKAFADTHIPATARGETVKAESAIAFNAQVRTNRLPNVDRWLAAHNAK